MGLRGISGEARAFPTGILSVFFWGCGLNNKSLWFSESKKENERLVCTAHRCWRPHTAVCSLISGAW